MAIQIQPIFSNLLKDGTHAQFKLNNRETRDWFRQKASEVNNVNVNSLVGSRQANQRAQPIIGQMFLFQYNAKHKETLPYYDRFPLVFPIQPYDDGFLGINMHYLPHLYRARLMDALYSLLINDQINSKVRLRLSYQILQGTTKFRYAQPCIKRYLYKQVQGKYLAISPQEWDLCLFLPLERFTKSKTTVHAESVRSLANR